MTNETQVTDEPKPVGQLLASSHATATVPAAWQTPLPTRTEVTARLKNTETMATLRPDHQPVPTALHKPSRKTKIIVTLSAATENGDVIRSLLDAGVSGFRLNPAWVGRESALKAVYAIRSLSTDLHRPIALLLETQLSASRSAQSPALSESDWTDIRFGLECGVDWIAVSAGREGDAVRQLRQFLAEQKRNHINILARIEDPSAVGFLDQVIQQADGIVIEPCGPGNEPTADAVNARRSLVQQCVSARKLVIIATRWPENAIHELLSGHAENPEVTAAAREQPDALMLAQDNGVGSQLLQNVQVLDRLVRREESNDNGVPQSPPALTSELDRAVAAAFHLATQSKAEAVAVFTPQGHAACLCAAWHSRQLPIFAFTPDTRLARRLRLRYALEPIVVPFTRLSKVTVRAAEKLLLEGRFLAPGATVVFITDIPDPDQRFSPAQMRVLGGKGGGEDARP